MPLVYIQQSAYETLRMVVDNKNAALERRFGVCRRYKRFTMAGVLSDAIRVLDEPTETTDTVLEGK